MELTMELTVTAATCKIKGEIKRLKWRSFGKLEYNSIDAWTDSQVYV